MTLTQAYRGGDTDRRPGWFLHFSYDADTVENLKRAIPHTERQWDDDKKRWWVSETYAKVVLGLFPSFEAYLNQPRLFS